MTNYEVMIYDRKIKDRFLEVVDEKTYNREIIFAKQTFDNNEALQNCTPESIRNAIVNVALTGATLNPALQQAFLIPRKSKCCLDFSYRGLVNIAVDSTSVYDIDAVAVFEGDTFYYELGLNPILRHIPQMHKDGNLPEVIAAYAVATLHHGIKKFIVLDKEKIERARKTSQMPNGLMWKEHYDEGAKKTAVKLLYKLLPQSERMSTATAVLNEHEGIDFNSQKKAKEVMKRFDFKKDGEIETMIDCPNDPDNPKQVATTECEKCGKKEGCPAYSRMIDAQNS